jgi:hypothetical protein
MHVITIAPFTASNALDGAFLKVIPQAYLTTARNLLKPHNIAIEVLRTGIGDTPCVVTWDKAVDDEKNGGDVRKLCEEATGAPIGSAIPVIFCMFFQASDYGVTVLTSDPQNWGTKWAPYVLINLRLQSRFNAVLLHELIHAAYGEKQPDHDKDKTSIFASCAPDRDDTSAVRQLGLPDKHVQALRGASFTAERK